MLNKDFIRIRNNGPLVISVETNPDEGSTNFVKTLFNNDWNFAIIGIGKPWEGFKSKLEYYFEFLKTIEPDRLVVLSDSRDVFCLRSPEYFEYAFSKFSCPIVVGLEIFCQGKPDDSKVKNRNDRWQCEPLYNFWSKKNYKPIIGEFVNSGLICGRVEYLIKFFEWALNNGYQDDQFALGNFLNEFPDLVDADVNNLIFHNSGFAINGSMATNRQWKDAPNFAQLIGRGSFFLHIPGITGSTGQKKIYNILKKIVVDEGFNSKNFLNCERLISFGWLAPGISDFDNGYWDKK